MKVICIDIDENHELVIGEAYEIIKNTHRGYVLRYSKVYGIASLGLYPKNLFITLDEYRNRKLEELGI